MSPWIVYISINKTRVNLVVAISKYNEFLLYLHNRFEMWKIDESKETDE